MILLITNYICDKQQSFSMKFLILNLNITILVIQCFWTSILFCQSDLLNQDSDYLFWQNGSRITFDDYKVQHTGVHAELALWTVLDLPQNTSEMRPTQMRFYIAPVCARLMSRAETNDSLLIAVDNIYFDILELSARSARAKLYSLPDSLMSTTELSKKFMLIVQEMHENRLRMNRKFYNDMFRNKKENALKNWQKMLTDDLSFTTKWSTPLVDCHRFLQNIPIESGFEEDIHSNAPLLDINEQVLSRNIWHAEFCQISRFKK